jgi:hypothetical protein
MADYFTLFSAEIPALAPNEREWATQLLDADCPDPVLAAAGIAPETVDRQDWPGFEWQFIEPASDLWIVSHGAANLEHVAAFVRAFLGRFRPAQCWKMSWAETCSKPRVGDFGGGAVFVTSAGFTFLNSGEWLERQRREFESLTSQSLQRALA